MKYLLIALSAVLVSGCMRPIPPEPPKPQVIEIPAQPPIPKVDEPKRVEPEFQKDISVLETWYTPESWVRKLQNAQELQKVIEEATRKGDCLCAPGDPLCYCL